MSKQRDQGTTWQREIIKAAQAKGYKAYPLAEQGINDPGDICIETPSGDHYIIEAKNRTQLNIHATLDKTTTKAHKADVPFAVTGTAVIWKRLVQKDGAKRRVQAGPPVVAISLDEYLDLIGR